ncbi:MAG: TetR/AcrR family transcriptional regulator [Candidatus Eremiobacteraeota bacterium]|nr:TetR/AcrR family transcriptional regulator [Candidatus Eremiobacteraeota bacterium]MBV9700512.1 TetR/AcrR family transcriptional regulator [Candidatus Eremiobacteraeota bacterium]
MIVTHPTVRSASPEETRERILAAAREVIGRKGKRGATTREIAEVAGVNEATLFRHFGTKEALLVACAQHFCGYVQLADVAAQLTGDLGEDLFVLARTMFTRFESLQDMIRWSLVEQEYEKDIFAETTWRPQLAILAVLTEFMQRRIGSGELTGDAQKLAMVFLGLIFMHALGRKKFPASGLYGDEPESALRFYIDVFLNGVRKR